jgi:hypothetical protein
MRDSDRGASERPVGSAGDDRQVGSADDERTVVFSDDDQPVLPDQTRDDTDRGWGEDYSGNDRRLLDERPPHWD